MLGTPPAFILSQDQTLCEYCISKLSLKISSLSSFLSDKRALALIRFSNYCLSEIVGNSHQNLYQFRWLFRLVLRISSLWLNFHTMKFSRFLRSFSPPLGKLSSFYILAHRFYVVNNFFLTFYKFFCCRLFALSGDSFVILSPFLFYVNTYFCLFLKKFV